MFFRSQTDGGLCFLAKRGKTLQKGEGLKGMKKSIKHAIISVSAIVAISAASVFGASAACINKTQNIECKNSYNISKIISQQTNKDNLFCQNYKITINGIDCSFTSNQQIKKICTGKGTASNDIVNNETPEKAPDTSTDTDTNINTNTNTNNSTNTSNNNSNSTGAENATQGTSNVSDMEREVVVLINQIRASYGLPELTLNEKLSSVARVKAQDMASNKYFSHTSPTYGSPFDMMRSFGITYNTAGENIAMGYKTAEAVVNGWMNSEGHRANILNSSFTQIGMGYVSNGNYWVQMFIG